MSVLTDAVPGARALEYRFGAALPDGARDARIMVVDGSDTDDAVEVVGRLPGLKLVQTLNAGYDRWVGRLPEGVALSNARGAIGRSVAEWVVAVLLAELRELARFAAEQARGEWQPGETGTLNGRRVLVLGAGDLATSLRDQLTPFGAGVTLTGRTAREGVRSLAELDDLARDADVLVAMLPLSEETAGIVDAKLLARLPDGATVVNVGRGPLVVTDDLVAELRCGRLRAALDVTDPEPLPPDHPLWTLPGRDHHPARHWRDDGMEGADVGRRLHPDRAVRRRAPPRQHRPLNLRPSGPASLALVWQEPAACPA